MGLFADIVHQWTQVGQFVLIFLGFFCMGAACGFERSLLPRMAIHVWHEVKASTRLSFVATFGLSKALANAMVGPLADRFGRKPMLILGFLVGLPVMPFVIVAKSWGGITVMNGAFGLSQGFIGSSLFFLIIDLMGPKRRGVAVGVGECTIYVSTALVNVLAGQLASKYGYRPVPFYAATGFALIGLLSTIPLKDTLDQVRQEQSNSQRQNTRKYARMMSMQPGHLDEDYVEAIPRILSSNTLATLDGYISPRRGGSVVEESVAPDEQSLPDGNLAPSKTGSLQGSIAPDALLSIRSNEHNFGTAEETQGLTTKKVVIDYQAVMIGPSSSDANPTDHSKWDVDDESTINSILRQKEAMEESPFLTLLQNPSYASLCLGGMVLNFKDGFAWGSFPVFFKQEHGLSDTDTDLLIALYPLCWGFAQAFTGALSDQFGRKIFLALGTASCTIAMALYALPTALWGAAGDSRHVHVWVFSDILLGLGTAFVYPALQAAAADEVDPINRGLALGFYRFVRDMGYVVGAVVCGQLTDAIGYEKTFLVNAAVLACALVGLIIFYQPKSAEEAALSVWFANVATAALGEEEQSEDDEDDEEDSEDSSNPLMSSKPTRRVLVSKCSDSF